MVWAGREDCGAAIPLILVDGTGRAHHGNSAQHDEQDLHLAGGARRHRAAHLAALTGMPILATLIVSGADVLVSGDRDLLELRGKHPIETPAEFVRRLA